MNGVKELDLVNRVPEEPQSEIHDIVWFGHCHTMQNHAKENAKRQSDCLRRPINS